MENEEKYTGRDIHDRALIRDYLVCRLADDPIIELVEQAQISDDKYAFEVEGVEEDIIEEYLEGTLGSDERRGFEFRLRSSEELRQKVVLVRGLREIASKSEHAPKPEPVRRPWGFLDSVFSFRFAAAAAAVVLVGVVGVWYLTPSNDAELAYAQLQRSVAGRRIAEGRTSIQTTYAPLINTRGPGQTSPTPDLQFLSARATLLKSAVESPNDPGVRHALGLMYLAEGDLNNAINELTVAEKLGPDDAALLSDLATVYLARSSVASAPGDERTRDRALSLEYADRALAADPNRTEALFNRAAILESLGLNLQAKQAWNNYLARDPNSEWAAEARRRLERLDRSTSGRTPGEVLNDFWAAYDANDRARAWEIVSETKELITGSAVYFQLTDAWLNAARQNRKSETAKALAGLRFVGGIEADRAGDKFFEQLSEYYASAGESKVVELSEAQRLSALGYSALRSSNWTAALNSFESARAAFLSSGNNWEADVTEFQIGYVLTQLRRIDESLARLMELEKRAQDNEYRWLASLANGWIASDLSLNGEYSTAIRFNKRSLELAEAVGDTLGKQKAIGQLTNQYIRLGDELRVLEMIERNVSENPEYFLSPRQRSRNLLFASQGFGRSGSLAAAAAFAEEQLLLARDVLKDRWLTHSAYLNLAKVFSRRGDKAAAAAAAEECSRLSGEFEDESMRRRLAVQSQLLFADVRREGGDCPEAVRSYDRVITEHGSAEFATSLYFARKGRLLCGVELGMDEQVTSEMTAIALLFEQNRRTIEDEAQRNIFFDSEQVVYDAATEYAYTKMNDPALALMYAESSRANTLLTRINGGSENVPASVRIPPEVAVLYFSVLDDRTLIWAINSEGSTVVSVPISGRQLADAVRSFNRSVQDRSFSAGESERLYELLVQPVWLAVAESKVLCIIPDKSLLQLPFAALRSRDAGRFLIEDIAVLYSPSLRVFDRITTEVSGSEPTGPELLTAIGASQFDADANPSLDELPEADEEARTVAAMYPSSRVLTGKSAVKRDLWDSLRESSVLHFAGHFVTNKADPSASKLLLADGHVTVDEIFRAGSVSPRLVVLSACESGVEGFYAGEGMIGASRAFLAAGVPLVIGTQWSVDSAATADLMTAFHRRRAESSVSSIEALRIAQMEMIKDPSETRREPFYWAGFMSVGGYSIS